jgi:putative hydroxymethylpyrimidine transport system substrate-binding protein
VMDINDFGIARERGLDLVAIAAVVQRPLASVIARDPDEIRTPADLAGKTIGVTGVPSDDAVLDTVLRSGGVDPSSVHRVTIGFNAVADLAAGKIDAATAFWNAEGVQLRQEGIPIRELRVDDFGAPRYPELVVATSRPIARQRHVIACAFSGGLAAGYHGMQDDFEGALEALLDANPDLDRQTQQTQMAALRTADAFSQDPGKEIAKTSLFKDSTAAWAEWARQHGLISRPALVRRGFWEIVPGCNEPTSD